MARRLEFCFAPAVAPFRPVCVPAPAPVPPPSVHRTNVVTLVTCPKCTAKVEGALQRAFASVLG